MPYLFKPPTVLEGPIGGHRLFDFYKQDRGVSVLKIDGTYYDIRFPTEDLLATASEVYIGGPEYEVSDSVAAALTAAGSGDRLTAL